MNKKYINRIIDDTLQKYLNVMGAVLIIGPKWCGKTTTGKHFSKSILKLQDAEKKENYLKLANIKPKELLEGEKPRLIDEWQLAPVLWDVIRDDIDESSNKGSYILTGSTMVDESKITHTGTGRIHRLMMKPFTLFESGESNGKISVEDLFNNPNLNIDGILADLSIDDLIFASCRGGWPECFNIKNKEDQLLIAESYIDNICEIDVSEIDGTYRDSDLVRTILMSYSKNISTLAKNKTILGDVCSNYKEITQQTLSSYVEVLKKLFVINDINAWSPNIRSKTAIRTSNKKCFVDPSIVSAILNLNPKALLFDLKTYGFIFETLCIRDLSVYTESLGGKIKYYADRYGLEVDCVLTLKDGRYGLIEFKVGSDEFDKGAKNLLKLNKIIKDKKAKGDTHIREPSFLAIITGNNLAETRDDGVKIIPIACLKP